MHGPNRSTRIEGVALLTIIMHNVEKSVFKSDSLLYSPLSIPLHDYHSSTGQLVYLKIGLETTMSPVMRSASFHKTYVETQALT